MADSAKRRTRHVGCHLQSGARVSVAGDYFYANCPTEPRIFGSVTEAINQAGKVRVRWDVDNTISSVHHEDLMDFEVGQCSKENIEEEHALVVEGEIPMEDGNEKTKYTILKIKSEKEKEKGRGNNRSKKGLSSESEEEDTREGKRINKTYMSSASEEIDTDTEEEFFKPDIQEKVIVTSARNGKTTKKKNRKGKGIKKIVSKKRKQESEDSEEGSQKDQDESDEEKENSKPLLVKIKAVRRKVKKVGEVQKRLRKKAQQRKQPISEEETNALDASEDEGDLEVVFYDVTSKKNIEIVWKEGGWSVDPRQTDGISGSYGPRLNRLCAEIADKDAFFFHFFPTKFVKENLIPSTNKFASQHNVNLNLTYEEFIRFLGLIYSMEIYKLPSRDMYWWDKPRGIFPALNFGSVMSRSRFNDIIAYLAYSDNEDENLQIIDFVDAVNRCFAQAFVPGDIMCLDESMVKSYHRNLQGKIKIKRKPRPIGNEIKDIADARSKLVYKLEIYEGKDRMSEKEHHRELGATTATVKRLVEGIRDTNRIVVGDSWFGSVKTAVMLREMGLYANMLVKTAHKNYPMKMLNGQTLQRGQWKSVHAEVQGENGTQVKLLATDFLDLQLKHFISTCSTSNSGPPRVTKHHGDVQRPYVAYDYLEHSAAIDIFNHVRHGSVGLEDALMTKSATLRQFCGIVGFIFTNAFLAFVYFKEKISHQNFKVDLANMLVNFQEVKRSVLRTPENYHRKQVEVEHCLRKLAPKGERKQLRCFSCFHRDRKVVLSSYYCVACKKALCAPTSGRLCFERHIVEGLPELNDMRKSR